MSGPEKASSLLAKLHSTPKGRRGQRTGVAEIKKEAVEALVSGLSEDQAALLRELLGVAADEESPDGLSPLARKLARADAQRAIEGKRMLTDWEHEQGGMGSRRSIGRARQEPSYGAAVDEFVRHKQLADLAAKVDRQIDEAQRKERRAAADDLATKFPASEATQPFPDTAPPASPRWFCGKGEDSLVTAWSRDWEAYRVSLWEHVRMRIWQHFPDQPFEMGGRMISSEDQFADFFHNQARG